MPRLSCTVTTTEKETKLFAGYILITAVNVVILRISDWTVIAIVWVTWLYELYAGHVAVIVFWPTLVKYIVLNVAVPAELDAVRVPDKDDVLSVRVTVQLPVYAALSWP